MRWLIILLLVCGCSQELIETVDEPDEIEQWIEFKIERIFLEADQCIKSCPVIGSCVEDSCISRCSSDLDTKITELTHAASQKEHDLTPTQTNEMIYTLVEFDPTNPPAAYLACIQGCFNKCFDAPCIRGCEL